MKTLILKNQNGATMLQYAILATLILTGLIVTIQQVGLVIKKQSAYEIYSACLLNCRENLAAAGAASNDCETQRNFVTSGAAKKVIDEATPERLSEIIEGLKTTCANAF